MRNSGVLALAVIALAAAGCPEAPQPGLQFPEGLKVEELPADQKALLRVTLEISEAGLDETDVVLDLDDFTLKGSFNLQNAADGERVATLRVYGRFSAASAEVLLGRATDQIEIVKGQSTGLDFDGVVFESCAAARDGACSLEFDRNRNGTSNIKDLLPLAVEGLGIDPAEQPTFIEASPETLQFASGIRLGGFARQVIVLENRGPNAITFDSLDVGGGQGVALSLFDPFGGPVGRPRRSIPAEELGQRVEPGDEFLIAVSFAPVNAFLTTAGVQIVARDTKTNVVQSTRVKVIANADGTLRPQPGDYVEPDIGASLGVGNGTIPVGAFPAQELFSGQEITTGGLVFAGAELVVDNFTMPADRGFVIDIPAESRLAVSVTDLESDIDLAVVSLNAQNAVTRVEAISRHPLEGSEGVDVVNLEESPLRVVVILGRVELDEPQAVEGGLALDIPAPFQLVCELSKGPEFSDQNAINPGAGPLEGGTPFTLRGRGFQPGAIVSFADFRALDVVITVDPLTEETVATGLMPPGSLEVGKNPATAVVSNPSIENGGDGQAATLPEAFLYDPPAARIEIALPDVSPTTGTEEPITILGSFFTNKDGPPRVNFGDFSTDATFVDSETLRVVPIAQDAGTVVLTVQNQIAVGTYGAKSNGLAFRFAEPTGPTPSITGVDPATGPADGGDTITINGSGFVGNTRVLFGTLEAAVVTSLGDAISVTTPAVEFDGEVAITVVNPDGQSATLPNAFSYFFPEPRIDGLLPTRVPTTGGTLVIVTGQSFRNGLSATFRPVDNPTQIIQPLSAVRASNTSLLVTTPPLPAGGLFLHIENPDGQFVDSDPLESFEPQGEGPTIVFVDPATGPIQGQNLITIAGNNFDEDGVKVVLAGTTFELEVEKGAAAGFDRVQLVAPPALTPGTQPIVLENGDGQSAVASYLYVIVDVARIDQVLPRDLHFLPGNEIQVLGEFFSAFESELQFFLGTGQELQTLPLIARSDGLIIGRVTQRLRSPGFTPITLSDGVITLNGVVNVVVPEIASAEERNDEIEVIGSNLAGNRLHTFCAGAQGYRVAVADDDALLLRRDASRDQRCPQQQQSPRPIRLLYDGGNEAFDTGSFVTDETDADGDGVGVRDDPDDGEPCIPNLIAAVCDFDEDGVTNATDPQGQDPCIPSTNAAPCTKDTDGDGVRDPLDNADADACLPNSESLACTADADNDGVVNPFDPQDANPCSPNPGSAACSADADADGVTDAFDPVDDNSCVPNTTALNCDADRDAVFPPADANNEDPCVPDDQDPLCTDDDDRDGTQNSADTNDADPCIPNNEALTCAADADGDGVVNPFDPRDADPCAPNPASPTCTLDTDGDGVVDSFDPVDNNSCIPNVDATNCDADGDLVLPPTDGNNQDPCVPDDQDPLCTDDDDRDGTRNADDVDDVDACVPNAEALTCTADADGDGVVNPFDPADADPCAPNPASPTCTADSDGDGVIDSFDPVDANACIPNITATNCDADADGVLPPLDTANQDPCIPDDQDPLCTDDDDRDGTRNGADTDDTDACVPDAEALTCTDDADSDGVSNPFDPQDADPCTPNPASPACNADSDVDGITDAFDPVDNNPCIPDVTALNCDADGDGALPPADSDNQDPCTPDDQDPLCTDDDDRDGTRNGADDDDTDPCVPDSEALTCAADADGDDVVNPFDPRDADPCAPNPASPACTSDVDADGVTDSFDPVDTNACIPNTTATNCDADGDGTLPPADTDNTDPCVPDNQDVLCTDDDDRDGTANAVDADDTDPCIPDDQALACTEDADGDGVQNPFDPDDVDPCAPNPASPTCVADADGDGVIDSFDPVDNNACIPNTDAANCDADGDGATPATDPDNLDPCVPDNQQLLCTDDDDRDGTRNAADPDDVNACIPDNQALTCTDDADGDGVVNPFDPQDANPCAPNPASPACNADGDGDGVTDAFDPVDDDECIPNTTATNCDADGDGVNPPADPNNTDPCIPDANDPLCGNDDDRDGVLNAADANDADACNPNPNALTCTQDADADGVVNPFDPDDANGCVPNAASATCTADADADGTNDVFDPNDANACVPNTTAGNCDADGDGVLPPTDTNNTDACVPNTNAATCTRDDDADGVLNPADPVDNNACIPNTNALTCTLDDDGDGVANPFDSNDTDGCIPNAAATTCVVCGDGLKRGAEACDDGNNLSNDGCDGACQTEPGSTCSGTPSNCVGTCGDNIRAADEECDDGDLDSGDGCSAQCVTEFCGDGINFEGGGGGGGGATVTSVVFRFLNAQCNGAETLSFEINGVNALNTTVGGICSCQPGGFQTVSATNPAAMASIINGNNTFRVNNNGSGNLLLAWATAQVTTTAGAQAEFVIFDFNGGNHALTHNPDLCTSEFTAPVNNLVSQNVTLAGGGNGKCDDGDNVSGDGCSATCDVEAGFTCTGSPSVCTVGGAGAAHTRSCLGLKNGGQNTSGIFTIDPDDGGPIPSQQVFCDMTTDGGGYTFQKVFTGGSQDTDADNLCISRGMRLIIPRTQAHLRSAVAVARNAGFGPDASDEYMSMAGVYPLFNGANCVNQQMNSSSACQWDAQDGGNYFLHDKTFFGEPNGDNCTNCSLALFAYDGVGDLTSFNDGNHAFFGRFMCSTNDKQ